MNIMVNRIMHPSVLWPNSPQDTGKRLPAGQVGPNMPPVQPGVILRSPASESNNGWLDEGLGKKVDLLV
jgi:hypothetical protein